MHLSVDATREDASGAPELQTTHGIVVLLGTRKSSTTQLGGAKGTRKTFKDPAGNHRYSTGSGPEKGAKPSPRYPARYPQTGTQRFRTIMGRFRNDSEREDVSGAPELQAAHGIVVLLGTRKRTLCYTIMLPGRKPGFGF